MTKQYQKGMWLGLVNHLNFGRHQSDLWNRWR